MERRGITIFCPVTGEVISDTKFSDDGLESKFLTEFEELCSIGSGGYGFVSLCRNKIDEIEYAVKKIPLNYADSEFQMVRREVLALSTMNHPNIVRYYQAWLEPRTVGDLGGDDEGEDEGHDWEDEKIKSSPCLYIQQEYCPNSLKKLLAHGKVEEIKAWIMMHQIVDALVYMHSMNVVHHDLSTNNIFLDLDGNIKIGDFGLALCLDKNHTSSGCGQSLYKAPEIEQGAEVDCKVDVYSLAIVFFEMFSVFSTDSERNKVLTDLRDSREVPESWLPNYSGMLKEMISQDPNDRPDIHTFKQRLRG